MQRTPRPGGLVLDRGDILRVLHPPRPAVAQGVSCRLQEGEHVLEDDLALPEARRHARDLGARLAERAVQHRRRNRSDQRGLAVAPGNGQRRVTLDREGAPKKPPLPREQPNPAPGAGTLRDGQVGDVVSQGGHRSVWNRTLTLAL